MTGGERGAVPQVNATLEQKGKFKRVSWKQKREIRADSQMWVRRKGQCDTGRGSRGMRMKEKEDQPTGIMWSTIPVILLVINEYVR